MNTRRLRGELFRKGYDEVRFVETGDTVPAAEDKIMRSSTSSVHGATMTVSRSIRRLWDQRDYYDGRRIATWKPVARIYSDLISNTPLVKGRASNRVDRRLIETTSLSLERFGNVSHSWERNINSASRDTNAWPYTPLEISVDNSGDLKKFEYVWGGLEIKVGRSELQFENQCWLISLSLNRYSLLCMSWKISRGLKMYQGNKSDLWTKREESRI